MNVCEKFWTETKKEKFWKTRKLSIVNTTCLKTATGYGRGGGSCIMDVDH